MIAELILMALLFGFMFFCVFATLWYQRIVNENNGEYDD